MKNYPDTINKEDYEFITALTYCVSCGEDLNWVDPFQRWCGNGDCKLYRVVQLGRDEKDQEEPTKET